MDDPHDRTDRFELIAACDPERLVEAADPVVAETTVEVLQAPTPQLVMHRVREPVEGQPFNLGEVVVTAAEVAIGDERGVAVVPGKAEKPALSGAVVDAAVAADHPRTPDLVATLEAAGRERDRERRRDWARRRETTVDFEEMEDHT